METETPEKASGYLKLAQRELSRVVQISKQTLTFSRETSALVRIQLSELIEEVLALHTRRVGDKNLRVVRQSKPLNQSPSFPERCGRCFPTSSPMRLRPQPRADASSYAFEPRTGGLVVKLAGFGSPSATTEPAFPPKCVVAWANPSSPPKGKAALAWVCGSPAPSSTAMAAICNSGLPFHLNGTERSSASFSPRICPRI